MYKNNNKSINKNSISSKNIFKITFLLMLSFAVISFTSLSIASNVINMQYDEENGVSQEAPIGETEDIMNNYINVEKRRGDKANASDIQLDAAQYSGQIISNQKGETEEIHIELGDNVQVVRSIQGGGNDINTNFQNDEAYAETAAISIETEQYNYGDNIVVRPDETTASAIEESSETTSSESKSAQIEGIVRNITGRVGEALVPITESASETTATKETEYSGPKSASIVNATLSEAVYVQTSGENKGVFNQLGTMVMELFDHSGPKSESETAENIKDFSLLDQNSPAPAQAPQVTKVKKKRMLTIDEQVAIYRSQGLNVAIIDVHDDALGWIQAPAIWDNEIGWWKRLDANTYIEYEEEIEETLVADASGNTSPSTQPQGGILGIKYVGEVDPFKYIDVSYDKDHNILSKDQLGFDASDLPRGLYQHEDALYYIMDGGVVAQDYMYTTDEGDRVYFGDDGKQVKNQKVEYSGEFYYFDQVGIMAKDQFVYIREETDDGETLVFQPYFFGPGGKAYRAPSGKGTVVKQIGDDKFVFDEYGRALHGFISVDGTILDPNEEPVYETCMYHCGDIAYPAIETGWYYYDGYKEEEYDDGKDMWLYFSPTTGKKVYQTGNKLKIEIIDGQRYGFDEYGVLVNGWTKGSADGKKYFDFDGDGSLVINGWIEAVPGENSVLDRNKKYHDDGVECWFYISRGSPITKKVRNINGHKYCFDDDGVMQYGFVIVQGDEYIETLDSDATGNLTSSDLIYANTDMCTMTEGQRIMFFDDPYIPEEDEDDPYYRALSGAAVEGKEIEVSLSDGEFKFYADGRGGLVGPTITTPTQKGGKYYQNGILLEPRDDRKYGLIREGDNRVDSDGNHTYILVDKTAKAVKGTKVVSEGGKNGNYIAIINGKFAAMYSSPIRHTNQGWWYKDEAKWVLVPNNELPPDDKVLDLEGYLLNTEEYDGPN